MDVGSASYQLMTLEDHVLAGLYLAYYQLNALLPRNLLYGPLNASMRLCIY